MCAEDCAGDASKSEVVRNPIQCPWEMSGAWCATDPDCEGEGIDYDTYHGELADCDVYYPVP